MTVAANDALDRSAIQQLWHEFSQTSAIADAIHQTLREAIVQELLPPGYRLAEVELGELLGVSRTPVREALHRLEAEGIAVRIQRRGLEVRRASSVEIEDAYDIYGQLVDLAVRRAAGRQYSAEAHRLQAIHEQLQSALKLGDSRECARLGDEFHRTLHRASGNDLLVRLLDMIRYQMRAMATKTFQQELRSQQIIDEHEQILDALSRGDGEAAALHARTHIEHALAARLGIMRQVTRHNPQQAVDRSE